MLKVNWLLYEHIPSVENLAHFSLLEWGVYIRNSPFTYNYIFFKYSFCSLYVLSILILFLYFTIVKLVRMVVSDKIDIIWLNLVQFFNILFLFFFLLDVEYPDSTRGGCHDNDGLNRTLTQLWKDHGLKETKRWPGGGKLQSHFGGISMHAHARSLKAPQLYILGLLSSIFYCNSANSLGENGGSFENPHLDYDCTWGLMFPAYNRREG